MLRDADTAMYRAKARASGGTQFFSARHRTELLRHIALTAALETAIRDGALEVRYQPIVSIADGQILALEALVRWRDPIHGRVPPEEFIPLAEENGLIVALGHYVLGEVAPQIGRWRHEQPGTLPLGVFVNVSPQELSSPEFVGTVTETLRANGLSHSDIAFELTERAFISQVNRTLIKNLAELTNSGGHIVLDDFGTGYSALVIVAALPARRAQDRPRVHSGDSHSRRPGPDRQGDHWPRQSPGDVGDRRRRRAPGAARLPAASGVRRSTGIPVCPATASQPGCPFPVDHWPLTSGVAGSALGGQFPDRTLHSRGGLCPRGHRGSGEFDHGGPHGPVVDPGVAQGRDVRRCQPKARCQHDARLRA